MEREYTSLAFLGLGRLIQNDLFRLYLKISFFFTVSMTVHTRLEQGEVSQDSVLIRGRIGIHNCCHSETCLFVWVLFCFVLTADVC